MRGGTATEKSDNWHQNLEANGLIVPILVDSKNVIIAGHARYWAAKRLGWKTSEVIRVEHLTDAQVRAYRLVDNKIVENATWDKDLLKIEFNDILELDVNFDLELTGFDIGEIDIHLGINETEQVETVPGPERNRPATSRAGDLWMIGDHRLKCGDALDPVSYDSLMASKRAQLIFTDPPYTVPIGGHVPDLGHTRHREFTMASGEMTKVEFTEFLRAAFEQMVAHACETAIHYICMDWRHMGEVLEASDGVYHAMKNLCVWGKTNAGMGSFYRSQHQLVFVFKSGAGSHINNFGLGERGHHRSNPWTYAGANTFHVDRDADLAAHPTVKPITIVRDAIFECSKRRRIILDPFAVAGTTLIAAARAGRRGYGIEIDPHYADLILRRLETETGQTALHAATGLSFAEMKANAQGRGLISKDDDKVGYGNPPKHTQCKRGQSGNPKGRKKGARGFKTDLRAELSERIDITENGKTLKLTKQQLIVKQLAAKAIRGEVRSISKLADLAVRFWVRTMKCAKKSRRCPQMMKPSSMSL